MTRRYFEDTDRLELGRPDAEPLATETVSEIVELIEALIERGHAYESGGDVYFRVRSFDGLRQALQPRPRRDGPGRGGRHRDAEGGRARLRPVEGAQGRTRTPPGRHRGARAAPAGTSSARRWPRSSSAPTSRSTAAASTSSSPTTRTRSRRPRPRAASRWHGSGCTTGWSGSPRRRCRSPRATSSSPREAIDRFGRDAVVAFIVSGHYRQPLEFSEEALEEARARVERIRNFLREGPDPEGDPDEYVAVQREALLAALADDFNTPRAMAAIFELISEANRRELPGAREAVADLLELVGLERLAEAAEGPDPEAEGLLRERDEARATRDFERADRLREQLAERGYEVRDDPDGARLVPRGLTAAPTRRRLRAAARGGGRAGPAARAPGLDLRRHPRLRAHPDRRQPRPPGGRRRGRSLSLRRPRRTARSLGVAGAGARPGAGPAQPRGDLPLGRGRRRRRGRDPVERARPLSPPRPARHPLERSSTCRSPG